MGAFKAKKRKASKFDDLPSEWKENLNAAEDDDVMDAIAKTALYEVLNKMSKTADQDLSEKVAQAKEAGLQYREATKMNTLKIAYARALLEARGRDVGQVGVSEEEAA